MSVFSCCDCDQSEEVGNKSGKSMSRSIVTFIQDWQLSIINQSRNSGLYSMKLSLFAREISQCHISGNEMSRYVSMEIVSEDESVTDVLNLCFSMDTEININRRISRSATHRNPFHVLLTVILIHHYWPFNYSF